MPVISMKALLEAGVHFGHRTRRWNPKMKTYIFTERNGIHIIDLQQTLSQLERAYATVQDIVSQGGTVLFVGTKKQAQDTVAEEAVRSLMPFVNQRWLGGTLTNWRTIRQRIDQLISLEQQYEHGDFDRLTKKEALEKQRLISRLQQRLGGLRNMSRLPDVLFVTDTRREALALAEANRLHIPVIAMVDTNSDPDPVSIAIPANDDAIRAIKLIVGKIADAAIEGRALRERLQAEAAADEYEEDEESQGRDEEDERYLAPGLLAKLRGGQSDEKEAAGIAEDAFAEYEFEGETIPPADVTKPLDAGVPADQE